MGRNWNCFELKEENLLQICIKSVGKEKGNVQRALKIIRKRSFPEECRI